MIDRDTAGPRACRGLSAALLLALAAPACAIQIEYLVTDLTDTTPGQDRWRYDYRVSNGTFLAGQGFFVEFDYNTTSDLQDPPPAVNGDWDPQVAQPSQILPDNGLYDAMALPDNPSLLNPFSVEFVWTGGAGGPGAQSWTVYDDNFAPIESGTTTPGTPAVPIPAPAALIVGGLLGLAARRRRHARGTQ